MFSASWRVNRRGCSLFLAPGKSVRYNVRMKKFMTATKARKNFYAVIDAAGHPGVAVAITHAGMPKVVIMSFEEYEGWQETMEIMADPVLNKDLEEAMKDMKAGNLHKNTISLDEVKKRLAKKSKKKPQHR